MQRIFSKFSRLRPKHISTLASVEAYAQWAENYPPDAHNALMQTEQAAMLSLMPDLAGKVVLDLACGTGRYGRIALERGAKYALGLDNSFHMLIAGGKMTNNLAFALTTTDSIALAKAAIDVVLCGLAVGHVENISATMTEIGRVLKPGGYALISDFHPFLFLTGRKRTFQANGKTYAVEHYAHLYTDMHQAAWQAGMQIDQVVEPTLQIEGKQLPAVIVYRLQKSI